MTSTLSSLCVDCADPARVAAFWAAALGWPVKNRGWQRTEHGPDGVSLGHPDASYSIDFRWVPDAATTVKNKVHLDVHAVDGDQDAELHRLLDLGATVVDVGQRPDSTWHVLGDPEGNVFCLVRTPPGSGSP